MNQLFALMAKNAREQSDPYYEQSDPYYETGLNAPGMRGSDPSMDYNSLMLNPPPYSRGIAGNITSTEDMTPFDYDALVKQRQAQNLIDNPDMDEWPIDPRLAARQRASDRRVVSRQKASDRRNASMDRLSERQAISDQRRIQRQVEMEDTRNRASSRRELKVQEAANNRAAAKIRALSRMPGIASSMDPRRPNFAPEKIEQVYDPLALRDRWRDNKGLFQGGREGRLFGRARDWVEDRF